MENGKFLKSKTPKKFHQKISPKLQSKIAPIPSKRDWGYWKGDGKGMERGWKGDGKGMERGWKGEGSGKGKERASNLFQ